MKGILTLLLLAGIAAAYLYLPAQQRRSTLWEIIVFEPWCKISGLVWYSVPNLRWSGFRPTKGSYKLPWRIHGFAVKFLL